jgi:hypothetical protein
MLLSMEPTPEVIVKVDRDTPEIFKTYGTLVKDVFDKVDALAKKGKVIDKRFHPLDFDRHDDPISEVLFLMGLPMLDRGTHGIRANIWDGDDVTYARCEVTLNANRHLRLPVPSVRFRPKSMPHSLADYRRNFSGIEVDAFGADHKRIITYSQNPEAVLRAQRVEQFSDPTFTLHSLRIFNSLLGLLK